MSYQDRQAIGSIVVMVAVWGTYFVYALATWPVDDYQPVLFATNAIGIVLLGLVISILKFRDRKGAALVDERDRLIGWRSERIGGFVILIGMFATFGLVLAERSYFAIANAMVATWMIGAIADQTTRLVLSRRAL